MQKKFTGRLIKLDDLGSANLGWRVVDIPFDVKKAFGAAGRVPVTVEVNGFPFRTSLFPRKDGKHYLLMNKQMQKGAGTSLGDSVKVTIELDEEERTIATPRLLHEVLEDDPDVLKYFESFTYSMRKFMSDTITSPKSREVQHRRAERIAEILFQMREGESQPPPILEIEFAHNPKARKGWERMTAAHRRGHLWGIFYYQNPVSRAKRAKQAFQDMVKYAEKAK